jgi:hypothetical protein
MNSGKSFLIGALVVAVAVLGFLFYQETQSNATVKIQLPTVKVN